MSFRIHRPQLSCPAEYRSLGGPEATDSDSLNRRPDDRPRSDAISSKHFLLSWKAQQVAGQSAVAALATTSRSGEPRRAVGRSPREANYDRVLIRAFSPLISRSSPASKRSSRLLSNIRCNAAWMLGDFIAARVANFACRFARSRE